MATFGRGVGGGDGGGGLVDLPPVATTSGTYKDITEIAEDAVYVAVIVSGVSANATNRLVLKLGTSSGFTGQPASASFALNSADVAGGTAQNLVIELHRVGDTNTWVASGDYSGATTLTGALERVQITLHTIGNSDAFDAGHIAAQYSSREGVGPIASTADLPEGTNGPYYYTDARADARIAAATLGALSDVPAPVANKMLRRNAANSAYELVDDADIESVFGITAAPAANQIIKRNAANTAWIYAADATGGGGGGSGIALTDLSASGIISYDNTTGAFSTSTSGLATAIDGILAVNVGGGISKSKSGDTITLTVGAIPQKASTTDLSQGTEDTKFVTTKGVRTMQKSVDDGTEWTGFTFQSATDTPATGRWSRVNNDFYFGSSDANVTEMDDIFGENSNFSITKDAANKIVGEMAYAWRVGNVMGFRTKGTPTQTGDLTAGSVALHATGALFEDLKEQGFLTSTDLVEGTNITLTTGSDGRVTIAASGGGAVTFASQSEVDAGTVANKAVAPDTLHGALEDVAHAARLGSFQYAGSLANLNTTVRTWWINADGTRLYIHSPTTAMNTTLENELRNRFQLYRDGVKIQGKIGSKTSANAQDSTLKIFTCTITNHNQPGSITLSQNDEWALSTISEQAEEILENAPDASIDGAALAIASVGPRAVEGLRQITRMYLNNDGSGSRKQNISNAATTQFATTTVASDNNPHVKSWAVGGTTADANLRFDQRINRSLLPGAIEFSSMRAEDGCEYDVRIDGEGTFFFGAATAQDAAYIGLEVGLMFRDKAPADTTWQAWTHCNKTDVSRTIDGVSTVVYDASALQGNPDFLGQNKSLFRTKSSLYNNRPSNSNDMYADVAPPFWTAFGIGASGDPFPVSNRDYQFRFVFHAPTIGTGYNPRVERLYNYIERLVADRVA